MDIKTQIQFDSRITACMKAREAEGKGEWATAREIWRNAPKNGELDKDYDMEQVKTLDFMIECFRKADMWRAENPPQQLCESCGQPIE